MVRVRSLKHKITLGCIVLGLGALLTSTLSMVGMSRQDRALTQLQAATKLMRDHMEADMGHDAIRGEVVSIVASRQTGAIDGRAAARELAERLTDFEAKMEPATRASDAPAIVAARSAADPAFRSYVRIGREIAGQGMRGEVPDDARLARFQQLFSQLEGEMARISDAVEAHSVETTAHAEDVSAQSRWAGLVSMTALLTLLVLVARYLRLSVAEPIAATVASVRQLAHDRLDVELEGLDREDEIGDLSRSVGELRDHLAAARTDIHSQGKLILTSIGTALSEIAAGNLAHRIHTPLPGPFEKLRVDFNAALGSLDQTLAGMQSSTERLHDVARTIGGTADELSSRNANQAASLEETAAAIATLADRVQGSTEAVATARKSVDEVGREVSHGGEVIHHAEEAMDRIEVAAQEIGKIVGLIDSITFQTNLLALNAGVEAARAGDAGKGFAVVANEVRALAQRSADAARDIRDLITNSSDEIGNGVQLVRDAGASLRAITSQMDEISRMMEAVASGASEQHTTIQAINATSREIEQITQSNGAAADRVSEASRDVVSAIKDVVRQLAHFHLGQAQEPATRARARAA